MQDPTQIFFIYCNLMPGILDEEFQWFELFDPACIAAQFFSSGFQRQMIE